MNPNGTDYISRHKSPNYVIRHGWGKRISNGGEEVVAARSAFEAHFEPLKQPMPTSAPFRIAKGRLSVDKVVRDAKAAGWRVSATQVHKALRSHPDYGTKIVAVNQDGTAIRVDWIIDDQLAAGKKRCVLCDKGGISPKGVSAHCRAPEHVKQLEGLPNVPILADMSTEVDESNPYYLGDVAAKASGASTGSSS